MTPQILSFRPILPLRSSPVGASGASSLPLTTQRASFPPTSVTPAGPPRTRRTTGGETGHRESIEVFYDPTKITYRQLLDIFWRNINPTQADGQFYDIGSQYTTAIYYANNEEKREATESRDALQKSGKFSEPIATKILPLGKFWPAEEHHQKYSHKDPEHYEAYHSGSGRDSYFQETWGTK